MMTGGGQSLEDADLRSRRGRRESAAGGSRGRKQIGGKGRRQVLLDACCRTRITCFGDFFHRLRRGRPRSFGSSQLQRVFLIYGQAAPEICQM
jgi:hypothetical protein